MTGVNELSELERSGGCLSPDLARERQRLVRALQEFDGHEHHLLVPEVFKVMHLEFTRPIGLVSSLAWRVGVFNCCAVVHVLASSTTAHGGPEIVEHVAMKTNAFARLQPDDPHPDPIALST